MNCRIECEDKLTEYEADIYKRLRKTVLRLQVDKLWNEINPDDLELKEEIKELSEDAKLYVFTLLKSGVCVGFVHSAFDGTDLDFIIDCRYFRECGEVD